VTCTSRAEYFHRSRTVPSGHPAGEPDVGERRTLGCGRKIHFCTNSDSVRIIYTTRGSGPAVLLSGPTHPPEVRAGAAVLALPATCVSGDVLSNAAHGAAAQGGRTYIRALGHRTDLLGHSISSSCELQPRGRPFRTETNAPTMNEAILSLPYQQVSTMTQSIVLIVPDPARRTAVESALTTTTDVRVYAILDSVAAAHARSWRRAPIDIVLLDVDACAPDDLAAIRAVREWFPDLTVIMLGPSGVDSTTLSAYVQAGADGYLPHQISGAALRKAIAGLAHGEAALPRSATRELIHALRDASPAHDVPPVMLRGRLSPREREVLPYLCAGHSNHEIAAALGVGRSTVKSHVSSILTKTGMVSRYQLQMAAQAAAQAGGMAPVVPLAGATLPRVDRHHSKPAAS
jgi:DNA-binding NarL/FixJ family response regulator